MQNSGEFVSAKLGTSKRYELGKFLFQNFKGTAGSSTQNFGSMQDEANFEAIFHNTELVHPKVPRKNYTEIDFWSRIVSQL